MAAVGPIEIPVKLVFGVPEAAEVRRLVIHPGDKLVVRLDHYPSEDAEADLVGRLRSALGDDVPVLILGPDVDLEVITQAPAPTAAERRKQARIAGVSPASDEYRRIV